MSNIFMPILSLFIICFFCADSVVRYQQYYNSRVDDYKCIHVYTCTGCGIKKQPPKKN